MSAAAPLVYFAVYGPLDDADASFCVRGWEPVPSERLTRLRSEVFAADLTDARSIVPDGYVRRDPSTAERADNPRLIETWWPPKQEPDHEPAEEATANR